MDGWMDRVPGTLRVDILLCFGFIFFGVDGGVGGV